MTFGATIAEHLAAGDRVDVHWWFDGQPMCWRVRTPEPTPPASRIYLVEVTDKGGAVQRYVDPRRLLLLPRQRAEQLYADNAAPTDRDAYDVHDALERALRSPERFGAHAYGLDRVRAARAMTTEEKLASIPRCEGVEAPVDRFYVPPRAVVARGPDNDNDPVWRSLLKQVGMGIGPNGRYWQRPVP